ncbi:hypothetical protein [Tenacibaculum aiptasiae]|uniref:hypothetical protein n=1 Tax=Tenacibaculum aiptasiae TaxID=426481 RepID=UPI00232D9603|nr:hypothetical protein [Tenacibaculum aiptasiae]
MDILRIIIVFCTITFTSIKPESELNFRFQDKIRIKEAIRISETYGDSIWEGFNKLPFTIVLVTDKYEYLINHPNPTNDFKLLGIDKILETKVYVRKKQFNKRFLATFPAVNGVNCIVIGTPENTGLNSTEWIITLLHERFHQYQYSSHNYHKEALALGISKGDTTGIWQLNYPFPYEDLDVNKYYEKYTEFLIKAVEARNNKNWEKIYKQYIDKRKEFKESLGEDDYKYISFQWYQEGIARYTEYAFLRLLQDFEPSKEVLNLKDFVAYEVYLKEFYTRHLENVKKMKLSKEKRITVYDIGFAEALIIEYVNKDWKDKYLIEKFDLKKLYD